jgi:hypothetical protein
MVERGEGSAVVQGDVNMGTGCFIEKRMITNLKAAA